MTKFELARTAVRWMPRSRIYVVLAILFVNAWTTNADVFPYAFAVWRPSIDALGDWRYLARHRFSRGKPMMSFLSGRRLYRQQLVSAHDWIAQANRSTSIAIAPRFWQNEAKMLN